MEFGFSDPHSTNRQSKSSQDSFTTLEGQSSHRLVGDVQFPGVDWLDHQNLIRYPQATQQRHPSITQPSPDTPIFGGQPPPPTMRYPRVTVPPKTSRLIETKFGFDGPEKQPWFQGFFALIATIDNLLKHGESLFEANQHLPIFARVTAKQRHDAKEIHYILETIGRDQKLIDDVYITFGFMKGYPHANFSSAVCRTFFLKRYKSPSRETAFRGHGVYRIRQFGHGVEELSRSKAADILKSSFEEKARAAFWRDFQQFSLNDGIAVGEAIQGSTAGPSNSGSTHVPGPAIVSDVQHKQQGNSKPRSRFSEPPPTTHQPHCHSSFFQEAAPVAPYPSSVVLPPPDERISHCTGQDGQRAALGNSASTFTMQGGQSVSNFAMSVYPTFPTATSVPWYMGYMSNSNFLGARPDFPGQGPIPWLNYQTTNRFANYDFTYRHVSETQAQSRDYNGQIVGPGFSYPPVGLDQTDVSRVAVSSNSGVPTLGQRQIQIQLEPASIPVPSRPSVPQTSSIPTVAPLAPATILLPRRGRPPKNKEKQSQKPHSNSRGGRPPKNKAKQSQPQPFHSYPQSTSSERVKVPQETSTIHAPRPTRPSITPVNNNFATAEALTHNPPPGVSFPHTTAEGQTHNPPLGTSTQSMSGFQYHPPYNAYQPGLVPQPSVSTFLSQAASSTFDFGVPVVPPPQTQQSFSEDPLRAGGMDRLFWDFGGI